MSSERSSMPKTSLAPKGPISKFGTNSTPNLATQSFHKRCLILRFRSPAHRPATGTMFREWFRMARRFSPKLPPPDDVHRVISIKTANTSDLRIVFGTINESRNAIKHYKVLPFAKLNLASVRLPDLDTADEMLTSDAAQHLLSEKLDGSKDQRVLDDSADANDHFEPIDYRKLNEELSKKANPSNAAASIRVPPLRPPPPPPTMNKPIRPSLVDYSEGESDIEEMAGTPIRTSEDEFDFQMGDLGDWASVEADTVMKPKAVNDASAASSSTSAAASSGREMKKADPAKNLEKILRKARKEEHVIAILRSYETKLKDAMEHPDDDKVKTVQLCSNYKKITSTLKAFMRFIASLGANKGELTIQELLMIFGSSQKD